MIAILIFLITKMMDDQNLTDFLLIKRNQMYGESLMRTLHHQGATVSCVTFYIHLSSYELILYVPYYKRLNARQKFQLCVVKICAALNA